MTEKNMHNEFKKYINSLHSGTDKLVNIVNGCIANDKINVHNAVAVGQKAVAKFSKSLPEYFYKTIASWSSGHGNHEERCVSRRERCSVWYGEVVHMSTGLRPQTRYGSWRSFQVWTLPNTFSFIWWIWSNEKNIKTVLITKLGVYQALREKQKSWKYYLPSHQLTITTDLPPRDTVMENTNNNKKLIQLICESNSLPNVNMIGNDACIIDNEEVDIKIMCYILPVIHQNKKSIQVVANDNDIFALLCHFIWKWKLDNFSITIKKVCLISNWY